MVLFGYRRLAAVLHLENFDGAPPLTGVHRITLFVATLVSKEKTPYVEEASAHGDLGTHVPFDVWHSGQRASADLRLPGESAVPLG